MKLLPISLVCLFFLAAGCKSAPAAEEPPQAAQSETPAQTESVTQAGTGDQISGDFITECFAGTSNIFIIPSDGSFWTAGYNHSGQLGLAGIPGAVPGQTAAPGADSGLAASGVVWDITQVMIDGQKYFNIVSVAPGENHTVILMGDGSLLGVGESMYGELGRFGTDGKGMIPVFTRLKNISNSYIDNAKAVAAGLNNTFYIDNQNSLWATGFNYYGELGMGNINNIPGFTQVPLSGSGDVKAVAPGSRHTALLMNDGSVWVCGYNFYGQLGLGSQDDVSSFTKVEGMDNAAAVAAGNYHTVILKNDGTVWTAGANYAGQLCYEGGGQQTFTQVKDDNGQPINNAAAIAANGDMTVILTKAGDLLFAGNYETPEYDYQSGVPEPLTGEPKSTLTPLKPADSAGFGNIKKVVLGSSSIYVLTGDGKIWAAGSNWYGQLIMEKDITQSPELKWIYPKQ